MFALGTTDFDTLGSDSGIVKPESGLTFFALDYHLRLLDDDSLWRYNPRNYLKQR
jgi:hypothetical protein